VRPQSKRTQRGCPRPRPDFVPPNLTRPTPRAFEEGQIPVDRFCVPDQERLGSEGPPAKIGLSAPHPQTSYSCLALEEARTAYPEE
jgi:hypothetical protein